MRTVRPAQLVVPMAEGQEYEIMIKDRFKHQIQHLEATNRNNCKEPKQ